MRAMISHRTATALAFGLACFVAGQRSAEATCQTICSSAFVLPDCTTPADPTKWPANQPLSIIGWCGESCCSPPPVTCSSRCETSPPKVELSANGRKLASAWVDSGKSCGGYPRWQLRDPLKPGTYEFTIGTNKTSSKLEVVADPGPSRPFALHSADQPCAGLPGLVKADPPATPPDPGSAAVDAGTDTTAGGAASGSAGAVPAPAPPKKRGCGGCGATTAPGLAIGLLLLAVRRRRQR